MRRFTFLTAAATAATLFLASCKDSGTSGLDIPKDAASVVHINTSSLTSKLSWDEIKNSAWFKEMAEKKHDSLTKKLLDNPENSGVDMKSDFVFFTRQQGRGGYMVFEGRLKDAKAFENMLKQMNKEGEVVKEGSLDFKYMKMEDGHLLSWTDSKFIMMSNNEFDFNNRNRWDNEGKSYSTDSLKFFTKDLLNLKSSASLEKDSRFSDLLKQSGDVHFWVNADPIVSSAFGEYMSMFKAGSLLEGNAFTSTLSFENGRISWKYKTYYGKDLAKLMEKTKARKIDNALLSRIPSNDVVGAMAISFDPAFLLELFKAAGVDGMLNGELGKMNLTLNEVTSAFKGDILFSVSDLQPVGTHGSPGFKPEKDVNFLMATSVNNKATFEKVMGMFKEKMDEDTTAKYQLNNDWFAVSNKRATLDQFLAGANNKQPFADKIAGNSFGMYVDIQRILKNFASEVNSPADSATYDASVKMWQDVVVTDGEFVVNLVDKSKNSLKQLNEYAEKMNAANNLRRKQWMNTPTADALDSMDAETPVQVAPSNR